MTEKLHEIVIHRIGGLENRVTTVGANGKVIHRIGGLESFAVYC